MAAGDKYDFQLLVSNEFLQQMQRLPLRIVRWEVIAGNECTIEIGSEDRL